VRQRNNNEEPEPAIALKRCGSSIRIPRSSTREPSTRFPGRQRFFLRLFGIMFATFAVIALVLAPVGSMR
jgi:hypothetical protein